MGKDIVSSLVLAGIGLYFLIYSYQYELGTLASPGEAVFPLLISVAVLAMAAGLLLSNILGKKPDRDKNSTTTSNNGFKVLAITVVIAIALSLIEVIGFFTTSLILVALCCRILGVRGWPAALAIAGGATLGAYLIFGIWLKVSFPAGLLI